MRYASASLDDLKTILLHSVMRYRGEVVFVEDVAATLKGFFLTLTLFKDRSSVRISLNSRHLDTSPVPLGYCNTPYGAVFLSRKPSRTYKQGLSSNNLYTQAIDREANYLAERGIVTEELANCIKGNYPSFDIAVSQVIEKQVSIACSRFVAITSSGKVLYHSTEIGSVDKQTKAVCFVWGKEKFKRFLK